MDTEIIKLKIKCFQKFVNISDIKNRHGSYLYLQYFQSYESKLQNLNNMNIFNDIQNYFLVNRNCLPNIIDSICLENKEMFEDFISF
jgi:hypothetical protein